MGKHGQDSGGGGYKPNRNGYFGREGNGSKVRHMPGGKKGAWKFFVNITTGYESERSIGKGIIRTMPDDTNITYRPSSSSDGTAVVEIHNGAAFTEQKIHFVDWEE